MSEGSATYRDAGVDVAEGRRAVERMRDAVDSTHTAAVLGSLGSFGALYHLTGFRDPVLVAGSDGVGTKVELARAAGRFDTIGIDLVAMSVNDVLCQGARPLFFLDYIALDRLDAGQVATIVGGVAAGCREAGCALIGGETAEMPGVYKPGRFDLAGFCVGAVERSEIVDGSGVRAGMAVVGLASSGLHANGFSLVRRLFPELEVETSAGRAPGDTSGAEEARGEASAESSPTVAGGPHTVAGLRARMLEPTRIYVDVVQRIRARATVYGMAHITGGGWVENLPRALGPRARDLRLVVDRGAIAIPEIVSLVAERGLDRAECYRTFNMGVGFALIVEAAEVDAVVAVAADAGVAAAPIGRVCRANATVPADALLNAEGITIR